MDFEEGTSTANKLLNDPSKWFENTEVLLLSWRILHEEGRKAELRFLGLRAKFLQGEQAVEAEAIALKPMLNLYRVSQMLYQMAMESDLKGIAVSQGKTPMSSHDLAKLAADVGISLSAEEVGRMSYLTRMNQLGRYRVGRTGKRGDKATHGAVSFKNIERLYGGIWSKIRQLKPDLA